MRARTAGSVETDEVLHQIEDGDTLEGLAREYLGDSQRAAEIFEANRDVLDDPEILPLGRELRIPQKEKGVRNLLPERPQPTYGRRPVLRRKGS